MAFDLLLKGGTVLDPARALHRVQDVAFAGGAVAAVRDEISAESAATTLDCRGLLVVPGLIDLHVHVYAGVSHYGIDPDPHCLARGVTTAVDAGSAGADTFPGFRRYVIDVSATRLFAHMNISSQGMLSAEIGELADLRFADVSKALAMIEAHRDVVLGVKVRLTRNALVGREAGMRPLYLAREAADAAGLALMVHPQDAWSGSIDPILAVMRRGDVLTHCFHAMGCGILDERGRVRPSVYDAVERGVVLDVGHGAGSFSWDVAQTAMEQGVLPRTISSDLHRYNLDGPVFDLLTTVSKFLALGMELEEALSRVTSVPAEILGMTGKIGTLAPGAWGDAVVLALEPGRFPLTDSHGVTRQGSLRLQLRTVIRNGRIYPDPS